MPPAEEPTVTTGERRDTSREPSSAPLRIRIENPVFEGRSDNISSAGVFFFSSDRLRVTVELEDQGQRRELTGHLVRVQRMSPDSTGYAIEFEPD